MRELRKLPGLRGERSLEPIGQRDASQSALSTVGTLQPEGARKLEERQRVAPRLVQDQAAGLKVQVWCDRFQQIRRRSVVQRADIDLQHLAGSKRGLVGLPHADDEEDVGRLESAGDKVQDRGGRQVQPLKVVRNHDQRTFVGDLDHQAQRGQTDKKHFGRCPGAHSKCREKRIFLGTRKRAD